MQKPPRHLEGRRRRGPMRDARRWSGVLLDYLVRSIMVLVALVLSQAAASAQVGSERYSSFVMDARTGRELLSVNADEPRHPASLTKMMTLYMVFEALRDRRITLFDLVPVSPHAASQSPTKLGLMPGTKITVEQAILGLVTKSANDAAAALGEMLSGDEDRFAQSMTLRARALGMINTVFRNASGLPDPDQLTTARDMALLARHLVADFPSEYHYFSIPRFSFHGRMIPNHDHMLQTYPGADGIKTGYVTASGFNLVTSAVRSEVRLIGVVLGAARPGERDLHMAALLDQGFTQLDVPLPQPSGPRRDPMAQVAVGRTAQSAAAQMALPPSAPRPVPAKWSIQVGAFSNESDARQAAIAARRMSDAGQPRIEQVSVKGRVSYRAQIIGLSAAEANGTCGVLAKRKQPCMVMKPEAGQIARNF